MGALVGDGCAATRKGRSAAARTGNANLRMDWGRVDGVILNEFPSGRVFGDADGPSSGMDRGDPLCQGRGTRGNAGFARVEGLPSRFGLGILRG